jgi:hypothetical protein
VGGWAGSAQCSWNGLWAATPNEHYSRCTHHLHTRAGISARYGIGVSHQEHAAAMAAIGERAMHGQLGIGKHLHSNMRVCR